MAAEKKSNKPTRRAESTRKRKERMLQALEYAMGIVSKAAETALIERRTHYKWLDEDPEYAERVAAIQDLALDFVESQLLLQIKAGNAIAAIFYLKCRGKHRGYVERTELTGADGAPLATGTQTIVVIENPHATKAPELAQISTGERKNGRKDQAE